VRLSRVIVAREMKWTLDYVDKLRQERPQDYADVLAVINVTAMLNEQRANGDY
jgi:hypothetical protein